MKAIWNIGILISFRFVFGFEAVINQSQ